MSPEDLEDMVLEVQEAEFRHALAAFQREKCLAKAAAIREVPMGERTVAMLEQLAHYTREARAHEQAMNDAIRRAQAVEARANIATEERHDDGAA